MVVSLLFPTCLIFGSPLARFSAVRRRCSPLALLALAVASVSAAQPVSTKSKPPSAQARPEIGMPVLTNYSAKEYNGAGQVWSILQDRRGVMYFGDSSGAILEYDGVSWRKIFTTSTVTRSLAIDDAGTIWVGGGSNFGYLSPDASGALTFVSLLDKVPVEDRNFTDVWQTLITPNGIFFRAYERLFRWDGKQMHVWSPGPDPKSRFQALSAVRGHIYISQDDIGLQEIVGDELHNVPGGDAYRSAHKLFLHPYDEGRILISARDQALTLFDGKQAVPFVTGADEYLKINKIYTSAILPDGSICITSLTGGVIILEHDGRLRQIIDAATGLASSNTLWAYQDREGALWVGTDLGVSRVEIDSPISIFSRAGFLDVARFQGSVYAATGGGGGVPLYRLTFDPKSGRPIMVPISGSTQGFNLVVFKDPSHKTPDQLLAATSDGILKLEGDRLVPAVPVLHGLAEQAYAVYQSKFTPNRVFIGHGDGVGSIRWDGKTWIDEGRLPNFIFEARGLTEDAAGILWVSGANGRVIRVEVAPSGLRDSKVQVISHDDVVPEGSTDVEFVAGEIFQTVTRSKNIFRWDNAAHKFVVDNRFLLPIDAPDASAGLTPLASSGSSKDAPFFSFTASSDAQRLGLNSKGADGSWHVDEDRYRRLLRYRLNALHVEPDGIWGAGEGIIRFNPREKPVASRSFPTLVRQVNAGSHVIFGGTSTAANSDLHLPPGSNAIRFQFAALTYGNPSETNYQYMLEGADRDWSGWGKQKEANYSGLGPGSYRFRVRAQSDDGIAGEEGDFTFTILPPWYRTTLAYLLYGLLLLALIFAAWSSISRHEREKARRENRGTRSPGQGPRSYGQRTHSGDSHPGRRNHRSERQHRTPQRYRQRNHRFARPQYHPLQALRVREPDRGRKHLRRRPLPA